MFLTFSVVSLYNLCSSLWVVYSYMYTWFSYIFHVHCTYNSSPVSSCPTELALITNKPRAASVYAVGGVTCAGEHVELGHTDTVLRISLLVCEPMPCCWQL